MSIERAKGILNHAIAVGTATADNENYQIPMTIENAKVILAELEQKSHVRDRYYWDLRDVITTKDKEIERLNELVFAYESVQAPVNPLIVKLDAANKEIERLKGLNREILTWTGPSIKTIEGDNKTQLIGRLRGIYRVIKP